MSLVQFNVRILVTGGLGFIGSNFVRYLVKRFNSGINEIVILDNLSYAGNLKNLSDIETSYNFIKGDIRDLDLIMKITKNIDLVINFAAESHVDRSIYDPKAFFSTNIIGASNIFEACLRNDVKRVVQVSTDEVYGSIEIGSADENSNLNPSSPYSASKASADLIALAYKITHNLNVCITRSSNNFGPNQYPEKIIPLFIRKLLNNEKVPVYGSGKNIRNWIFVEDNCQAILKVALEGRTGEIYNVGSKIEMTNNELVNFILNYLELDSSYINYVEDRPGHDLRYSIDSSKIFNELKFHAETKFEDGLKKTIEWYRNNPNW